MKILYFNGKIYTGTNFVDSFIEEDGKFLDVGSYDSLKLIPHDKEVDFKGKTVTAGFNDSHLHILGYGYSLTMVDLVGTQSIEEIIQRIRNYIDKEKPEKGKWIIGRGWNQDYFVNEKRFPTKEDLDLISKDYPIYIMRVCFHVTCVNSLGLSLANINENTPNPDGGEIEKDSNGKLTGIVKENAQYMVYTVVPKPTLEDIKKMLFNATTKLNQFGITSAQSDDFTCFDIPYDTVIQAYQELEKEGKLNVRINQQFQIKTPSALEGFIAKGYQTGYGSDKFKIGPLKLLGDGSLGARTAFLQEPYSDDPSKIGILVYKQELLENLIKIAHNNNIQVAIHAIGDGMMKILIDTIEKVSRENPKPDIRHGIVHCQIMDEKILNKFTELKLLAYIQTIFIDYDITIVKQRIGEKRAKFSYNFKTLQDSGVNISNGSDCPVETPNPMAGIQCAVTRQDIKGKFEPYLAEQALSIEEAVKSYTMNGAFASFDENKKGQIKKDMISDFVIWDKDIFTSDVHNIHVIQPLQTFLGGKLVYQKN